MDQAYIDNKTSIMKDELAARIAKGDKMSVAASLFSMYAYSELKEALEGLDELRFVFTSDAFTKDRPKKEQRGFLHPPHAARAGAVRLAVRSEAQKRADPKSRCERMLRMHQEESDVQIMSG